MITSDGMKKAFVDDLNSHMLALEAAGYNLNEKILHGETEGDVLNPYIATATGAIDKFVSASKHIKKFVANPILVYFCLNPCSCAFYKYIYIKIDR